MAKTLDVVHAFDRSPIKQIPAEDGDALERKLALAAQTFAAREAWLQPHKRMAILRKTAELLSAQREAFARTIAQEGGKPWPDAVVEVTRAIDGVNDAADELRTLSGREVPMGLSPFSEDRWAFTTREPIGVVAGLSAFNHPLNLIVHQVTPAVATGCPIIIKPAPATPLSCLNFVKLLHEAGLPEAWCQTFVTDDNALAERLAVDARVGFVSFIGSSKVGWMLRSKMAAGTRCALEHGGAAPVIVDASADIAATVESVVKGGYYHAGQVCVSVQRIFVHERIRDAFVKALTARVEKLRVGDPLDKDTEVGPLIAPREVARVQSWIDEAVQGGAKLYGGGKISETTLKPCVLVDPPAEAKVSKMEIFGPVVCVYAYKDIDHAIATANSLPYAFQAAVYGAELSPALHAANRLDAAAVFINDHTAFRTDWMPFAGRKQSGYGTGGIPYTMRDMTHEKMVVLKHAPPKNAGAIS